ncbi:MAG: hypothetical protein WAN69_02320 [Candidatus Korobacteraceae bacterium]
MNSYCKSFFVMVAVTLTLMLSLSAVAQGPAELTVADPAAAAPAATPAAVPADPLPANPAPQYPTGGYSNSDWRVSISIYGWFTGVKGTAGALGHNAGIDESFTDVFHVLKGMIPITVEADKGRFVMPIDFFWVKMGIDNGIPQNDFGQTSINTHLTESIFTPKIGYRLYNGDHLKVDALGGIRYWYLGLNNTLEPSGLGNSRSANWVDGLGGARFIFPLGEKAAITVSGDAGAGGANLDYQALGLLNYQFTQRWGLAVGWRYLDVDYRPTNHEFVYDTIMNGPIGGINFTFGGKPPVPPTASCSASPTEVFPGDPVNASISTQNFNPKHTLTYNWSSTGAKVSGTGTTGSVDTTGLQPGSYTVTGTATDPKEKKNNVASCSAGFTVKARPNYPPTASCSASPSSIAINQSATVNITASSPESRPLTYTWTSTGGQLSGNGTSATLTATNADAGNTITVTGTATDDHNLSTSCTASVSVPPVQQVATVEDWGECTFEKDPKRPGRVDNDCKDVLDKLALRVQQMPNGKVAIVGYTDQTEVANAEQLGSQRAVNVKYYMTTDELGPKVDPTRLEPRKGGQKGKAVHFYYVPQGATFTQEESVTVDESAVQGQSRAAAPSKHKKATPPPAQ